MKIMATGRRLFCYFMQQKAATQLEINQGKFSHRRLFEILYYSVLVQCNYAAQVDTDVSEKCSATIFRVERIWSTQM
jgi:hypothetical protein